MLGAMAATVVAVLLVVAVAQGRMGPDAAVRAAASANVSLAIAYDSGTATRRRATLECRGRVARAGGYLASRDAARACRTARRLAAFLTEAGPPPLRPCTQIYGGPQTARVTGRIGSRPVDRRLSRSDGCAIADWDRAVGLLPATRSPGP